MDAETEKSENQPEEVVDESEPEDVVDAETENTENKPEEEVDAVADESAGAMQEVEPKSTTTPPHNKELPKGGTKHKQKRRTKTIPPANVLKSRKNHLQRKAKQHLQRKAKQHLQRKAKQHLQRKVRKKTPTFPTPTQSPFTPTEVFKTLASRRKTLCHR